MLQTPSVQATLAGWVAAFLWGGFYYQVLVNKPLWRSVQSFQRKPLKEIMDNQLPGAASCLVTPVLQSYAIGTMMLSAGVKDVWEAAVWGLLLFVGANLPRLTQYLFAHISPRYWAILSLGDLVQYVLVASAVIYASVPALEEATEAAI